MSMLIRGNATTSSAIHSCDALGTVAGSAASIIPKYLKLLGIPWPKLNFVRLPVEYCSPLVGFII